MEPETPREDPAERALFDTIRSTYEYALAPEQQAMVMELRAHLQTISQAERVALIDAIENAIGQNIEGAEFNYE